jgi:hypothetical protein
VNLRTSFVFRQENYVEGVAPVGLYEYDATILCHPLPMLIAPTVLRRRRLCFPLAA